jgi:methyl-accepting chemotaxis protein
MKYYIEVWGMFSFKLRQKILSVILFVILIVMVVSSLVVSYVTYGQNVAATNANIVVGVNNIKTKIQEVRQDLFKKMGQMDTVFKVSENVKFIGEFKKDYDLGMTESAFTDLANALFSTASANHIQKMAVYDTTGELVAFAEEKKDGSLLAGFYYVNPEKSFKTTRIKATEDLKKSRWETGASISDLDSKMLEPLTTATTPESRLTRQGDQLALSILVPVMVDDYNKETDKMEPRRFGVVVLSKLLDKAFVAQMSTLTGMHVNIFAGENLAVGDLVAYVSLDKEGLPSAAPEGWVLEEQAAIPGEIKVDADKYFQGLLPIYTGNAFSGAISVLTSNKIVMANTLQLVYTLVIVYLCCLVLIIPVALFFSGTMVKSLVKVTASLKDVAQGEGDLTQRIQITAKDEIGELSHWFNVFIEKLQTMIQDISKSSGSLARSVDVTKGASRDISDNSTQMLDTTQTVTRSTHEMSSQISAISRVVGQSSDNLDIVA